MKTVKNSLSLSNLFLTLMVASMTTLMFSSCTKENIPTEKLEQTLDITGAQLPKVCPVPGLYTVTSGKITVKNEAKIKESGILSIKGSIKSNDLKLVDNDGVIYQSKEVISWNVKVGETVESAKFKVKFTLKSMDQKLIKLELSVKFNPNVENSFEVEKAELEGTNVPCLIGGLN
jgi:hypothetical protein